MDLLQEVPGWILRPLPANAPADEALAAKLDELARDLPLNLPLLDSLLTGVKSYREYDQAANRAGAHVWKALERICASDGGSSRWASTVEAGL